jgi:hypothetical protein
MVYTCLWQDWFIDKKDNSSNRKITQEDSNRIADSNLVNLSGFHKVSAIYFGKRITGKLIPDA